MTGEVGFCAEAENENVMNKLNNIVLDSFIFKLNRHCAEVATIIDRVSNY